MSQNFEKENARLTSVPDVDALEVVVAVDVAADAAVVVAAACTAAAFFASSSPFLFASSKIVC